MSAGRASGAQGELTLVAQPAPDLGPPVWFCSHCGKRPQGPEDFQPNSRVCEDCGLGLLLECGEEVAPRRDSAFVVVDDSLAVCAVSREAERLLVIIETDAVNRHVTELLVPADAEAQGPANLAVALTWAARGDNTTRLTVVRPVNTFGIRLNARIAPCGPPRAALLVFE